MAKIRLHELARDLNMKNKELLEKLKDLDITVASHMSTLDEETADRIRSLILGKTNTNIIEETRVQKTVIRRRRKVMDEPLVVDESSEATILTDTAQTADRELEKVTAPSEDVPQKETVDETQKEVSELTAAPEGVSETRIKEEITFEPEIANIPAVEESHVELTAAPTRSEAEAEPIELKTEKVEEKKLEKSIAPKKKAKKAKEERPAKIIKLPVEPKAIEKAPEVKTPVTPDRVQPVDQKAKVKRPPKSREPILDIEKPVIPFPDKEARPKKVKRKIDEDLDEKKFFRKKMVPRKKTVVEGVDLYARETRIRKGHKTAKAKGRVPVQEHKTQITIPKAIKRRIKIDDTIILSDLAKRMGIKAGEMIAKLMAMGVMVTVNQTIDFDTALLVATEFEYELERAAFEEEAVIKAKTDNPEDLVLRPPVVTIMGHVDHGKTSLLDVIRRTNVTDNESGGITQHIGAYHVSLDKGQIVFLDTPGHEAFTAMRSRGASITDIVVLVVAADDGVMPQTIEAINHARVAKVPIIVAVNKIDKANADIDRVLRQLAEEGLVPESWGGDTIIVNVSAKQKQGIDDLLEMILLQAEVMELKANPHALAKGRVVEAKLDSGRGAVATVLVENGTLHTGDMVVCGVHYGKVRTMLDDRGKTLESAGPSLPVEMVGLSGVPSAGDELVALGDEKGARQISMYRTQKFRSKELAKTSRMSLEGLFDRIQEEKVKDLNIVLKADVQGSIEALSDALIKLSNQEVGIHIRHSATGAITESDVTLAAVSDAIIIGFNVRPSIKVQALANEENVNIRFYNIIYNVLKDVKDAVVGMMASTFREEVLGNAEVREVFRIPKIGSIAGCYITDGRIERGQNMRLIRDGVVCYEGKIGSLRHFKEDVRTVQSGFECGISIENYNDIKQGDRIECYTLEEIKPVLD